jgi:hypothetical protein
MDSLVLLKVDSRRLEVELGHPLRQHREDVAFLD